MSEIEFILIIFNCKMWFKWTVSKDRFAAFYPKLDKHIRERIPWFTPNQIMVTEIAMLNSYWRVT